MVRRGADVLCGVGCLLLVVDSPLFDPSHWPRPSTPAPTGKRRCPSSGTSSRPTPISSESTLASGAPAPRSPARSPRTRIKMRGIVGTSLPRHTASKRPPPLDASPIDRRHSRRAEDVGLASGSAGHSPPSSAPREAYFTRSQWKPGLSASPASIHRLYQRQHVVGLPKRSGTSAHFASFCRTHRIPSTIRRRSTGFPPRSL